MQGHDGVASAWLSNSQAATTYGMDLMERAGMIGSVVRDGVGYVHTDERGRKRKCVTGTA